jgi:hypothetical protein
MISQFRGFDMIMSRWLYHSKCPESFNYLRPCARARKPLQQLLQNETRRKRPATFRKCLLQN